MLPNWPGDERVPRDLRHFAEDEDQFQILTPEQAVVGICIALALAAIFWPFVI